MNPSKISYLNTIINIEDAETRRKAYVSFMKDNAVYCSQESVIEKFMLESLRDDVKKYVEHDIRSQLVESFFDQVCKSIKITKDDLIGTRYRLDAIVIGNVKGEPKVNND